MNHVIHFPLRPTRWAAFVLLFLLLPASLMAQRGWVGTPGERLGRYLDLTEDQEKAIQEAIGDAPAPGRMWAVAAALKPTLTEAQKTRLLALGDARGFYGRGRAGAGAGMRGPRGWRWDAEGVPDRPGLKAVDEARSEALGLSPEQDELLASWRSERARQRPVGGLPPEVAETLTDEQRELAEIHDGLAAALRGSAGRRGLDRPGRHQDWRGPRHGR